MRLTVLFAAVAFKVLAQHPLTIAVPGHLRGAAIHGDELYAWGERLWRFDLGTGTARAVTPAKHGTFGEGGCAASDGSIYLQDGAESGPFLEITPQGKATELDRRVEMHDCVATELLGHRGVLITDYYGQVRFYEGPGVYQEVYSFYTPSRQAGLARADVDGDGLTDIFAGNYWIRSPREFDLPWRLYAINLRHETADAATMCLVLRGKDLIAAQGHMKAGSVFRYSPPADVRQLWTERVLAPDLHFPHALASCGAGIVAGENNGAGSRLLFIRDDGTFEQLGITNGTFAAFVVNGRILTVGAGGILWWNPPGQRRR